MIYHVMQTFFMADLFWQKRNERTENKKIWKARFILQENEDNMKQSPVHNTSVIRRQRTKFTFQIAALYDFKLFLTNVTQAYLQSAEKLMLNVYLNSPKELNLSLNQLLTLLTAPY